jgi:hypothetical protein
MKLQNQIFIFLFIVLNISINNSLFAGGLPSAAYFNFTNTCIHQSDFFGCNTSDYTFTQLTQNDPNAKIEIGDTVKIIFTTNFVLSTAILNTSTFDNTPISNWIINNQEIKFVAPAEVNQNEIFSIFISNIGNGNQVIVNEYIEIRIVLEYLTSSEFSYPYKISKGNYLFSISDCSANLFENNLENMFTLHPNPVRNSLSITFNTNEVYDISILDLNGNIINAIKNLKNSTVIDLNLLKDGVYFIQINSDKDKYVKRFIKV